MRQKRIYARFGSVKAGWGKPPSTESERSPSTPARFPLSAERSADEDPLGAARGCLFALPFGLLIWAVITWWVLR